MRPPRKTYKGKELDTIWYDKKSKRFWLGITKICYDLRVTSPTVYSWLKPGNMPSDLDLIRVPMTDLKWAPKKEPPA